MYQNQSQRYITKPTNLFFFPFTLKTVIIKIRLQTLLEIYILIIRLQ